MKKLLCLKRKKCFKKFPLLPAPFSGAMHAPSAAARAEVLDEEEDESDSDDDGSMSHEEGKRAMIQTKS